MASTRTRATGRASLRVTTGAATYEVTAPVEVEGSTDRVSVSVGRTDPPLVSERPDVLQHWTYLGRRAAREALREDRRTRTVKPLPGKPPKPIAMVACPACGGERLVTCCVCHGRELVRQDRARRWSRVRYGDG